VISCMVSENAGDVRVCFFFCAYLSILSSYDLMLFCHELRASEELCLEGSRGLYLLPFIFFVSKIPLNTCL
jgi:hypothetical protein